MATPWPLTGRAEELAFALRAVAEDGGLVLTGAAGVGKSRLAHEVLTSLGADRRVIACAATTASASIPFGAVADLVGEVRTDVTDRLAVLTAVARDLRGGPPPVVGLDDAHLADDATAALVHHLVTRRLVIPVLTVRSGEAVPDAVTALWKDGHCARLDLQALSRPEADSLAAAALDGPVDDATRTRLWDISAGNPLLLRELVLQALDDGSLSPQRGHWHWGGTLAPGGRLIDVVDSGIGRLPATARHTMAVVAFGAPLDVDAVERLADATELKTLVDRGVLTIDDRRTVALGHPLYGEVVRARTSADDARLIKGALVGELRSRPALRPGDACRVGQWALEAGLPVDAAMLEAGAREAHRGADWALVVQLARADPSWATRPTGLLLGSALARLEEDAEALGVLARAAEAPPDDETLARIALLRTELLWQLDRAEDAGRVFTAASQALPDGMWRDLLAARWAALLLLGGRRDEASALLDPLVDSPVARTRVAALRAIAFLLIPSGRTARMLALCDASLASALLLKGEWEVGVYDVIAARTAALMMEGRVAEAEDVLLLGERANAELRDPVATAYIAVGRARVALSRGLPVTAERLAREALAGFSRLTGVRGSWTLRLLAEALALQGDADGAQRAMADAVGSGALSDAVFTRDGTRAAAWVEVASGDVQRARVRLRAEADAAREAGDAGYEALLLHDLVRLGAGTSVVTRLAEVAAGVDGPVAPLFAEHARALAADDGRALDAVSRSLEDLTLLLLAAEAATEAAAAHRRAGIAGRASAATARAAALRQRCEGARTPSLRPADLVIDLTVRERDVAVLAARGLSSKEIADALVLSRRTVDNHLHRSYEKLGITRREDLGAVLGLS